MSEWLAEVRRLKREVSVVEAALALGLRVRPKGAHFVVECPLCDSSKRTLRLDTRANLWYCFKCQRGGSVYDLFMRVARMGFLEAYDAVRALRGLS